MLWGPTRASSQVATTTISLRVGDTDNKITTMELGWTYSVYDFFKRISDCTGLAINVIERVAVLFPGNIVSREHRVLQVRSGDQKVFGILLCILFEAVALPSPILLGSCSLAATVITVNSPGSSLAVLREGLSPGLKK